MGIGIRLSRGEAWNLAFRRDAWLWVKVPSWLVMAWLFFLPQLWKIGVVFLGSWVAYFRIPGPAGPNVTSVHMTITLVTMLVVWFAVLWYTIYVMAFLSRPGVLNRIVGFLGVLVFPFGLIVVALAAGSIGSFFGVPHDELFAYIDRWTPVDSWKTIP